MPRRFIHILPVFFLFLTVSCNKDEVSGGAREKYEQIEQSTLVSVLKESAYTPEDFIESLGSPSFSDIIGKLAPQVLGIANNIGKIKLQTHLPSLDRMFAEEAGTDADGSRRWQIESYTFSYSSHLADGEERVLSGRVTFPNNTVAGIPHKVKTLSLHSHQALMYPDWAPSENLMFMPLRALWNSAVIEPDFQNFGINHGLVPDGNGSPQAMSRQLADCVTAALEIMRQRGVSLAPEGYSTNWGSSQAAAVPLLFAKYYETKAPEWFREAVRLRSSYTGEGALILSDVIPYYCSHPENFSFSYYYMCGYASGFSRKQLGGYVAAEIMSPWLSNTHVEVDGKDYTFLDAASKGLVSANHPARPDLTSLDMVISPDMVLADGSMDYDHPKTQAFINCLAKAGDLCGWTPRNPIYIAHSPEDMALPYDYSYRAYLKLSNQQRNTQVHMITIPSTGNLSGLLDGAAGLHALISTLMLLNMSCVEEPEDMMEVYGGQ